jgi:hypothetical protein
MKLFWKFYACLFFAIILNHGLELLNKDSPTSLYYNTLTAFNNWYLVPYLLHILNIALGLGISILIFNYAFNDRILFATPYWLFFLRLFCEFTGHSYDWQLIQTNFSQGYGWGFLGLATITFPLLPSYIAQWSITFKEK